jgi:ABC-type antimicrobial peptide transport system permease subunit
MLAGVFGVLALLLAALGLYGLTAYSVSRRRPEIGIRLALGATQGRVIRLILARVALLVALGAVGGIVASLWLSRYVGTLLYGLEANDPQTFIAAAVVLVAVGLTAGSFPAVRAARQHPASVLREN